MTQEQNNENISLDEMVRRGDLILPTGPLDREVGNPLESLSCAEVQTYMGDFLNSKIKNEIILRQIERHLKGSLLGERGCECSKIFSATKPKQRKEEEK